MEVLHDLDVMTLLVTFAAVATGLAGSLGIYWWRQRTIPGLGLLTGGVVMGATGVAALAARDHVPLWLSVIMGNAGVGLAHVLLLLGIRRFCGRPLRATVPAVTLAILTAVMVYDVLNRDDIILRSIVATIWLVGIKLTIAYESWRQGRHVAPRLWVVITLVFTIMAVILVVRLADILIRQDNGGFFSPSPAAALNFLMAIVGLVAGCMAVMALTNDYLQRRLESEAAENGRVARERDQAAQTADAANRAKSVFLAAVSHEIRTPINAVMGGLEILNGHGRPDPASPQGKVLEVMEKAGQSMLALLDDLLDITRIEAGHLSLVAQPMDLHQRLHDAIDLMAGRAAAGGLTLELSIGADVPRHVSVDAARLRQILLNLIGNAIKFTDRGGIKVVAVRQPPSVGHASATPGAALVRITVADTGIGIPAAKLPHVFDAFYQADGGDNRRYGGVGLGLAICKRLVGMMGGNIQVESAPGHGTVFTVDLPMPLATAPVQVPGGTARLLPYWTSKPLVLLVEDDSINQFVASQLLTRQGVQVITAEDGEAALAILAVQRVRLVLMDIGMPGMDGFETTARLRQSKGPMAGVPVVALTANVLPETVARSRAVGMQGFIAKPIRLEDLLSTLARIIPPDGMGAVAMAGTHTDTGQPPPLRPADSGPMGALRGRLGGQAVDALLSLAARNVAEARHSLHPMGGEGADADMPAIRRLALRMADGLDSVGFPADAQALRDCLGLLRPGQPVNTALAAMDAILADAQARLPRARSAAE
ncbi:ATP-binding protein [Niveispirillum sp.]|uniref:hybrid sensor histidine kinase/response regulator n=1 Tax=Niveispirillum sp. TaxID=1917217 RepID=UPI001B441EB8|nr:ATP-binding protein [Niveispirillum sp.]MBP7338060.1 response regulator [Niveispirillum sp.]